MELFAFNYNVLDFFISNINSSFSIGFFKGNNVFNLLSLLNDYGIYILWIFYDDYYVYPNTYKNMIDNSFS